MHFIVIAYDSKDKKAIERRKAVREEHMRLVKEMFDSDKWLYAVGILNNDNIPIGSMVVCDFPSREELEGQWLKKEPYILGNVWEKIEINKAEVAVQ